MQLFRAILLFIIAVVAYGQQIISISPSDTVMVCKGDSAFFQISNNLDSIVWVPQNGLPPFSLDTGYVFTSNSTLFILYGWYNGSIVDTDSVFIGVVEGGISIPNYTCVGTPTLVAFSGVGVYTSIYWSFYYGNPPSAITPGPHTVVWGSTGPKAIMQVVIGYGCIDTVYDTIQVLPSPVISAGDDKVYCKPDTGVILNAQLFNPPPGCSVSWFPADGLSNTTSLNPRAAPDTTTTYILTLNCNICGSVRDSVTVFVSEKPVVYVTNNPILMCEGEGGDTIFTNVSGGIPPYTYIWASNPPGLSSLSSPNPIVNPTDSLSNYSLVVRDSMGCESDTAKAYVVKRELPIVDAGPDITICDNGPGDTLKGRIINYYPGQVTYFWIPAHGLNDSTLLRPYAKPDSTTMYTLVAIEPIANCRSIVDSNSTVVVNVITLPKAQAGYQDTITICQGDTVQIGAVGQNGDTLGFQYVWTPALGLNDTTIPDPLAFPSYTTTYYLQVISKGCVSEGDSITIEVLQYPVISIPPLPGICPKDTILISPVVAPTFPLTDLSFNWTPKNSLNNDTILTPLAFPDTTTTYILTTTYKSKCSTKDTITVFVVNSPLLGLSNDTTICQGDTIQLFTNLPDTLNFVGYWEPNYNISSIYSSNPLVYPDTSVHYIYIVNYNSPYSSCVAKDTVLVSVQHTPNVSFVLDTNKICSGNSIYIKGIGHLGAADFFWFLNDSLITYGNNLDSINILLKDTSNITLVIKEGSCSDTDSVKINVLPVPTAYFTFDSTTKCYNEPVYFYNLSDGATFFLWNFGDNHISNEVNPVHLYDSTGLYKVSLVAFNVYGCSDTFISKNFVVINPFLKANFYKFPENDTLIMPYSEVYLYDSSVGNVVKYLWLLGDGNSYTTKNIVHYYDKSGKYLITLIITDDNGCVDTISKFIYIIQPKLDIPNVFTPNGDGFNDIFTIEYDGIQEYRLEIYDRYGNLIFESNNPSSGWDGTYNGKEVPSGTYYYILRIGEEGLYKGSVSLIR